MHAPAPTESDVRRTPTPWRLLALLMAMTAIGPTGLNILVPALPLLAKRLGTDTATVQLTVSLYLLGLATAQLMMGPLSDRFGRRPVVIAGLTLAVVAGAAATLASTITALIVFRILQAVGASTGVVIGRAIIRDLFTRDRAASMIGLVATVMVVAPMVAPLVGGILDTAFGWQAIFMFVTGATALVLLWAIFKLPETRVHAPDNAGASFLAQLRGLAESRAFFGYVLCAAVGSLQYFVFLGGGPHVVVSIMGRASAEYGAWFALSAFGYMAGNFVASRLAVARGIHVLIWWGILVELAGSVASVVTVFLIPHGGPETIFLPQVMVSFGNGLLLPNAIAGAVSVRPQAAGTASGITGFVQMGLGALGAQFIGHLLVHAETALPMSIAILCVSLTVAAAFIFLIGFRRDRG